MNKNKNEKEAVIADAKKSARKTLIIAISIALIVSVLIGVVWAVIYTINMNNTKGVDYFNDDLSKYLVLKPSDYKGYTIEIDVPPVTEEDVDRIILKKLADNKGKLMYEGRYVLNVPIEAGDLAYLRYIGYTIDENGVRQELDMDKYCNFTEVKPTEYEIGNGDFPISSVEAALIGKSPASYGKFSYVSKGVITNTDVIFCTVSYVTEFGDVIYENKKVRIDLSSPDLEKEWGIGALDYFANECVIGITDFDPPTLYREGTGEAVVLTEFKVDYAVRADGAPLTVEVKVPYDCSDKELRGKTVCFDIYIDNTLCYERAEFNDAFVKDTLGFTEEKLAEYKGETITDKYRDMIKTNLQVVYEEQVNAAAEEAMWTYLCNNVQFKKLPESEIQRIFENYYYEFQVMYSSSQGYYSSLDAYICSYYGLEEYENWRLHLQNQVTREVKERLIFYSILRLEGLMISDEDYPAIYRKELESDFEYYTGKSKSDYTNAEDYEKDLAAYEKEILDYYGADKYKETIYYYYASEKMLEFATVVNKALSE